MLSRCTSKAWHAWLKASASVWALVIISGFFVNDTATTEIYTLSLHDALPISLVASRQGVRHDRAALVAVERGTLSLRSEEHTSELQSLRHLVCRLLLEKKKHATCRNIILSKKKIQQQ